MESKKYYSHIAGLKGIACVLIMIGHFLGLYKYAQQFLPGIPFLNAVLDSKMSFLLDEGYWLYLFFFISGYLISKARVNTVSEIAVKSLNRFFRLAFPILFSYLIIYFIYTAFGFYNDQTANLFQCTWFQEFYRGQYSIIQVLTSPMDVLLSGNCVLNSPYWVLKEMFAASVMIYVLRYVYSLLSKNNEALCFFVLILVTFAFIMGSSPIIAACLIGMLLSVYEEVDGILKKPYFSFGVILLAMTQYAFSGTYLFNLFFVFLILYVPESKLFDGFLSLKPIQFLGKISWGIYSFHWPLMCSLGAMLMITMEPEMGLLNSYALSCGLTAIATLMVSVVFYFTFERLSSYLSKKIDICLEKLISKFSLLKS